MGIIIITAVAWYTYSIRENLKKQAYYILEQNGTEIANEIKASAGFAKSSIHRTSESASQSMTSDSVDLNTTFHIYENNMKVS